MIIIIIILVGLCELLELLYSPVKCLDVLIFVTANVTFLKHIFSIKTLIEIRINDFVPSASVILDPNTAHLLLSDDLSSLTCSANSQVLPDNPKRFNEHSCVDWCNLPLNLSLGSHKLKWQE